MMLILSVCQAITGALLRRDINKIVPVCVMLMMCLIYSRYVFISALFGSVTGVLQSKRNGWNRDFDAFQYFIERIFFLICSRLSSRQRNSLLQ
jgi:hypothetical protein